MGHLIYKGMVTEDRLEFLPGGNGLFIMRGELILRDRVLKLDVIKILETVSHNGQEPRVQTRMYTYNLSILDRGGSIFRYDSPHDGGEKKHPHHPFHHRHQYDPFSATPKVYTVTYDEHATTPDWPLLSDVVEEADAWYWENYDRLVVLGCVAT